MPNVRLNPTRLVLLALGVLALHALVLRGAAPGLPSIKADASAGRPVDRAIVVTRRAADRAPDRGPQAAEAVAERATVPPAREVTPTRRDSPRVTSVERTTRPVSTAAVSPSGPVSVPQAQRGASSHASELPVYPTRPPPGFALRYAIQRGAAAGEVEWRWQAGDRSYESSLNGRIGDTGSLAWHSAGGFDAAGLAPLRYTDHRPGRGMLAANFRRDAGTITFSGPQIEHPLAPGAQDGLSWLLQLAAIAAADPARVEPGGGVTMRVVGVHGEADDWTFEPLGREFLDLVGDATPTLHLQRLPQRAFDARAEVWLDPARHYLPVRVRWSNGGSSMQLEWRGDAPGP